MQRDGADVGSQVDMHSCTDACTHSNQGVGLEVGNWNTHAGPHRSTHFHM